MRKLGFISAFMLFFFIANVTGFADSNKPDFQVLLSGSLGFAYNKNLIDMTSDDADYFAPSLAWEEETVIPLWAVLPMGFDLGFRYFPGSNIGLGLEIGSHTLTVESKMTCEFPDKATVTAELTVRPIVGNIYYRFDSDSSNSFVLIGGGVGYYFGEFKYDIKPNMVPSESYSGKQSKIGFQLLLEYDYVFDIGLTLFGGAKYRYVEFDDFNGDFKGSGIKAKLTGVALYIGGGYSF